ncbi:MAG: CRISPR-associated helicase Cas3' [Oscillospiraceae bacterium]|nr:CRISPR-associated helicase Cas3' [Oscillospiraceae bacterium]
MLTLWGKTGGPRFGGDNRLPLQTHLSDTAHTAELLWESWVSPNIKRSVMPDSDLAKRLFVFLAGIHDVGKASPDFQEQLPGGKKHALLSYAVLERHGFEESLCVIVGAHHGVPPTVKEINDLEYITFAPDWIHAQDALMERALDFSGLKKKDIAEITLTQTTQVILSGLVIIADWIASNSDYFPVDETRTESRRQALEAFSLLDLPPCWIPGASGGENLYLERFGIRSMHPIQESLLNIVENTERPGIIVLEAPMGGGKTEAALVAAELLANRTGSRGVYFALPTQATSNAMFGRVLDWISRFDVPKGGLCSPCGGNSVRISGAREYNGKYSVRLTHGRAMFNDEYSFLKVSDNSNAEVHEWFSGRKKSLLADFAVGTVDHILMAGLKQKHLALRHLGLAGKVVVIDECHAYDCYMESYLLRALNWLGAYGVPVIVLSATLPDSRRRAVINAYLNQKKTAVFPQMQSYPQITYTDADEVKSAPVQAGSSKEVALNRLCRDSLVNTLESLMSAGGYAGIIVNTVRQAQELYTNIVTQFGAESVTLLHAGFLNPDRLTREKMLIEMLGKSSRNRTGTQIIIGTQIFEQSMDIDFDVLFTELCPMDLLLQRIGRLHRHNRDSRPEKLSLPTCYVMDASEGAAFVYDKELLERTACALPESIALPRDIPRLVEMVYGDYEYNAKRKRKAESFQISRPILKSTLIGWLGERGEANISESGAEATVRDGTDSLEVIAVQKQGVSLHLFSHINDGIVLPRTTPDNALAKIIAGCFVRLPGLYGSQIDEVISGLEKSMRAEGIAESWYASYWLKGSLVLIFDEECKATVGEHSFEYSRELGIRKV